MPFPEEASSRKVLEKKLEQKMKYRNRAPKTINLSPEAELIIKKIAEKRGIGTGDNMEILTREFLAPQFLSEQERKKIKDEADKILQKRLREIEDLQSQLDALDNA